MKKDLDLSVSPSKYPKGKEGEEELNYAYEQIRLSYKSKEQDPSSGLRASKEEHVKYYILVLEEMQRRGLDIPKPTGHPIEEHARRFSDVVPVQKKEANAVYLVSHAKDVYEGKKVLWVTHRSYPGMVDKELFLCGDKHVWGIVRLLSMERITPQEFDELRSLHLVTKEEQEDWWPGAKEFYAYSFRFEKAKEVKEFLGLPKGPQVFFQLTPKLIKAKDSIKFEFLGTKGEVNFPAELKGGEKCTCRQCKDPINLGRSHSGLKIDADIAIDGFGLHTSDLTVNDVILTHLHPDHAGKLWSGKKVPKGLRVHVWKGSFVTDTRSSTVSPLDQDLRVLQHERGGVFTIGSHTFRFFPVEHSTLAPTAAVMIDDRMIYAPDFLEWKEINPFKDRDVDLYIGDGSSMKRDLRRPKGVGHMSMFNQVKMCAKAGVKHVKFTHVGHIMMDHKDAKETLRIFSQEEGLYEDPNDVYVAEDGDYGELLSDGSIKWKGKTIHKARSFYKPNKPFWREFENERVTDIKGFRFPAKVVIKIDGMRMQVNTRLKTLRSEDEGFHKEQKFKISVKEMDRLPKNSIFDAEGVMVDPNGKPLHRTSFIGYANGKGYDAEKDANCQFWVFDVYEYEGKDVTHYSFLERLEILRHLKETEHFKVLKQGKDYYIVKDEKDLISKLEQVRKVPGSEGAMVMWDEKLETATNQNRAWVKLKNLKEIDCLVTDRTHPERSETGEPIESIWNYMIAAGPYTGKCEGVAREFAPRKKIVVKDLALEAQGCIEKDGKVYAYLGRTFNTKITAPVGGIIRVASPEVNKYEITTKDGKPTGCYHYGVFQPHVLEYVREKHTPDGLQVLDRLAALVAPRKVAKAVELDEDTYKEIREEGKPLDQKYYKFKAGCASCKGVIQRHWPTGKIVETKEPQKADDYLVKSWWWEEDALVVEFTGPAIQKDFNTDTLIAKFRDHIDLRMEKDSELVGITIHPPVPGGTDSWTVFSQRVRDGEKSQVIAKHPHPTSWLNFHGEIVFPTVHGARRFSVGKVEIKDRFRVTYAVQRKNLHEYFMEGGDVMSGRFVLRVILSPSTGEPIWIFVRPKDNQWPLNPTVHMDEGHEDILRNDKLTRDMAESPVRKETLINQSEDIRSEG